MCRDGRSSLIQMTAPAEAAFQAWWRLPEQHDLISYPAARRAWLAAWSAAQQAQRARDMASVATVLADEIPGVDTLLERVLDALREE